MSSKADKMREIREEVLALESSPLYSYRTSGNYYPVIGEGSHDAKMVFIGEAPGKNEAKTGRPFCGAAGKIFDELLASIGLLRKDIYITNIVKDRPPENRDPLPEEVKVYGPYLDREIEIIKPEVLVTLGRYSTRYIMERCGLTDELCPISAVHGNLFKGATPDGRAVSILPLYHPAAAIYQRALKETLIKDFAMVKKFL
ncbi:MAG: uracil-DNA glycosylase [Patescibacteria group bacterium]